MKNKIYFITGSVDKAEYFSKLLGVEVLHKKIDLDEIQSMNLEEIVQKKVRKAHNIIKAPVIVEDVSLEFESLGNLPGPFIKFFVINMEMRDICDLIKGKNRTAVAKCGISYFDGITEKYFEGSLSGKIAKKPAGKNGFGWDQIFIPDGYGNRTRAELNSDEDRKTYLKVKPLEKLKKFLIKNNLS